VNPDFNLICDRCPKRQRPCAGQCLCTVNGRDIHDNASDGQCPEDRFSGPPDPPHPSEKIDWTPTFHALWREFHAAPWEAMLLGRELDWLKAFAERVPCGDCRAGFLELLEKHPPDLSSREAYFAWTVALHNAVNRKLGKPEMSVEDARKIHRP
jgi:hypothetical protein